MLPPAPLLSRVIVFDPEATALSELSQPAVPPMAIVPASATLITTSGVWSAVGVVTAVDSVAAATVTSTVKAVRVRALAALPALSVKVIVQV